MAPFCRCWFCRVFTLFLVLPIYQGFGSAQPPVGHRTSYTAWDLDEISVSLDKSLYIVRLLIFRCIKLWGDINSVICLRVTSPRGIPYWLTLKCVQLKNGVNFIQTCLNNRIYPKFCKNYIYIYIYIYINFIKRYAILIINKTFV